MKFHYCQDCGTVRVQIPVDEHEPCPACGEEGSLKMTETDLVPVTMARIEDHEEAVDELRFRSDLD